MKKGAFQTSRKIFDNPIWNDIPKFRIFFYIYGNAVFSKEGAVVGGIRLKRGQFLRSYRNLQDDLQYLENRSIKKYSLSVIKRKIDSLVEENRLKIEDTELGTLFTVVNYEQYQGLENYRGDNLERRKNGDGTEMERSWNNNKNVKNVKECITTTTEKSREEKNRLSGVSNMKEKNKIINRYLELKGSMHFTPKDEMAAEEIANENIPLDDVLRYLEDCFLDFETRKRHARDQINSLQYCVGYIFDRHYKKDDEKGTAKDRSESQYDDYDYGF